MRRVLAKLAIAWACVALCVVVGFHGAPVRAFSSGAFPSSTGAPAIGSFSVESSCVSCHTGTVNSGGGSFTISAPANYSPNQNVQITVALGQAGRVFFGFE